MQQSVPHTSSFTKILWRIAIPVIALSMTVWMGMEMRERNAQELLWGWRPFFLMLSAWIAVLALVKGFTVKPERNRFLVLSSLSGVLLSAGFPPSPLTPLMFVGFVPLLIIEDALRTQYGRSRRWTMFKHAFNAFFIWNICTTWWIINTSFLPGIFAVVMNSIFMALVFMLFHEACNVLPKRVHAIVLAAFWISFEFLHLSWELSWPWLTLGNSLAQYPSCVQWYEYTGVFGGSLWILAANALIFAWYQNKFQFNKRAVWLILLLVVPVITSLIRYSTIDMPEEDVEVVVVQPNFEPHYEKFVLTQKEQLFRFLSLSRSILTDSTDYLVFPETSLGFIDLNDTENDFRIKELRKLIDEYPGLHIVTGLESFRVHETRGDLKTIREVRGRGGEMVLIDQQNSAIQLAKDRPVDVYFKSRLVPGAEFLPFRDYLLFLKPLVDMLQGSIAGLTGQETRGVFHSEVGNVAPVICYESVYGQYLGGYVRNGADMIFIVTNDGWWDKTPGHVQHLQIGALRAIEHRRPIARSANTGISCFVNIRGDVSQPTRYRETIAITGKIARVNEPTFYTKWGDMIARIAVFMMILLVARVIALMVMKRSKRSGGPVNK